MATGILSTAADELGVSLLSWGLLGVTALCYAMCLALTGWRLAAFPKLAFEDARAPDRGFGYFTFVAATNLLGVRLADQGWWTEAVVAGIAGTLGWVLLNYTLVPVLMTAPRSRQPSRSPNGGWLLWIVGTQSVASAAATLAARYPYPAPMLALAGCAVWSAGALLYVLLVGPILMRLLLAPLDPAELRPAAWITMGATAITVLAAGQLLAVARWLPIAATSVRDVAFALWAFGTWWVPLLLIMGVWRHVLHHVSLRYETELWSMVFPLGMYSVASQVFGRTAGLPLLHLVAAAEAWLALLVWALTFLSMLANWYVGVSSDAAL
jgi:tellurite resistance protein TehA-like permease